MLTKAEYLTRASTEDDWAPGFEAIDEALAVVYPGVTPPHLASTLADRAVFGGSQYLDGFSLFPSPNGYQHLVTYGMSTLYVEEESFGGEYSGWGYEMTAKVRAASPDECNWAVSSLAGLARYTYETKRCFEPYQFVDGQGRPLRVDSDTHLTSYVTVPDTEVAGIDTVHGRVEFIQLVGVNQAELDWVAADSPQGAPDRVRELLRRIASDDNPNLATDLARTRTYV